MLHVSHALILATCLLFGASTVQAVEDTRLEDWAAPRLQSGELMGLQAAVLDAEGVRYRALGRRSAEDGTPHTPQTRFQIGSVSKVFTHLLLAELVAQDRLAYDSVLGDLLPTLDFDDEAVAAITLRELATHTSGLPRLPPNLVLDDPLDPYAGYTTEALLAAVAAWKGPLQKAYAYSNFGTGLLGYVLGEADGSDYYTALHRHVLVPLGLPGVSGDCGGEAMAPGHFAGQPVPVWRLDSLAGAGALCASAEEVATLMQAALAGEGALAASWARGREVLAEAGPGMAVTAVWHRLDVAGQPVYWYAGGTGGYASFVGFSPASGEARVLLANSQLDLSAIGVSLFAPVAATSGAVTDAALSDYVGDFALAPTFVLSVTQEGDALYVQATGQPRLTLSPSGPDRFVLREVEASLGFLRDAAGRVDRLVLHQNGIDQVATRRP